MTCKICEAESRLVMEGTLLGRHAVQYYGCPHCGFLQTQEPHWLAEAYARPINRSDVGYVGRNVHLAEVTSTLLDTVFPRASRGVDFGGGYGLFVRMLRDLGHDFYLLDKFCPNLFVPDFEADPASERRYDLLTAFELFEHLDQPIVELERMLELSDSVLFSTELIREPYPALDQWDYYGLEHGQHVAFYSIRTLHYLAERFRLHLRSNRGQTLHLLSRQPVAGWAWQAAQRGKLRFLLKQLLPRRPSRLPADHQQAVANVRAGVR